MITEKVRLGPVSKQLYELIVQDTDLVTLCGSNPHPLAPSTGLGRRGEAVLFPFSPSTNFGRGSWRVRVKTEKLLNSMFSFFGQ